MTDPRPRRAVLLADDRSVERVLADPPARFLYRSLGQLAAEHPGRLIAGEFLDADGTWRRFALQVVGAPPPGWLRGSDGKGRRVSR